MNNHPDEPEPEEPEEDGFKEEPVGDDQDEVVDIYDRLQWFFNAGCLSLLALIAVIGVLYYFGVLPFK